MSLKIVYGRAGTGKSTYLFQEITQKLEAKKEKKEDFQKIYMITPEQFSFTAEKKLLDHVKEGAVLDAEVLTFGRMAYRVLNATRRATVNPISSSGKAMLIYHLLTQKKKELKFIGKSLENVELVKTQMTEFKKHGVTVSTLKEAQESVKDLYLKAKMQDMLSIYEAYQNEIEEAYIDENDVLTILASQLEEVADFQNCYIYLDEFVGFTKQEYEILRILLRKNNVVISVCTDSIDFSDQPDTDLFYPNKQTLDKLLTIAKEENVTIENPIFLGEGYRFKNQELAHLEKNIYANVYAKYEAEISNMKLFLAKNQYSEVERVGQEIVTLVRDKKYRFCDIAVITKNAEEYGSLCKPIFAKYNIPVFIDEKKELSQNVLVRYLLAILNIFSKNWTYEAVFEYVKTEFLRNRTNGYQFTRKLLFKMGHERQEMV